MTTEPFVKVTSRSCWSPYKKGIISGLDSTAPTPLVTLEPGTRLDRYELLCVLAQGGMANVWLARVQGKLGFEKLYAVKTILPHVAHDPAFKTMFLDEARIASRIEHPNVVHMADVGEFAGIPYLVMDLIEGEPLHRLPKACEKLKRRIPLGIVLRILADACHGLHAAHELRGPDGVRLGVVHRDMSPQNVLVSAAGVSKVIDFGVAKAIDRATVQTSAGTLKGKISYMPREQACGQEVDRRADTWALGAVLYYLLAGRPPYKEESQLATLQLAMAGAAIPPLPESMPASLRLVVARALEQDPGKRFQSAFELGEALEGLMRKLHVNTSHSDVGAFVNQTMRDKLDARRHLITNAIAEATKRQAARPALTIPVNFEDENDTSSLNENIVAMPTDAKTNPSFSQRDTLLNPETDTEIISSPQLLQIATHPLVPLTPPKALNPPMPASSVEVALDAADPSFWRAGPLPLPPTPPPRASQPEPTTEPSTGGAFVAFTLAAPRRHRWPAFVSAAKWPTIAGAVGGLIVAAIVVFVVVVVRGPSSSKVAANPSASAAVAEAAPKAIAIQAATATAPPPPEPVSIAAATPSPTTEPAAPSASGGAPAAPTAATAGATTSTPSTGAAGAAIPGRFIPPPPPPPTPKTATPTSPAAPAAPAKPVTKKRRDDEAGF